MVVATVLALCLNCPAYGEVLKEFEAPDADCAGLAYEDDTLWVLQGRSAAKYKNTIFHLDLEGNTLQTFYTPVFDEEPAVCWGLAHDGTDLWLVCREYPHDKLVQMDESGSVLASYDIFDDPRGLAWDGEQLWAGSSKSKKVYTIDPDTGSSAPAFNVPNNESPEGMTWDGSHLWITTGWNDRLLKVDPASGEAVESYKEIDDEYDLPYGLAWDGEAFWGGSNWISVIFRFDLTEATPEEPDCPDCPDCPECPDCPTTSSASDDDEDFFEQAGCFLSATGWGE
jgi:hypothetical protein